MNSRNFVYSYINILAMSQTQNNVIVSHRNQDLWDERYLSYVPHVLCLEGSLSFEIFSSEYKLSKGEGMILPANPGIKNPKAEGNLELFIIFVSQPFLEVCTPRSNYGLRGSLSLHNQPVMQMTPEQFEQLHEDFKIIEKRINGPRHLFLYDVLTCVVQTMFLDFFDAHAAKEGNTEVTFQNADLLSRFMNMLQKGEYIEHREVSFYADKLFVTPKYLSEVCKDVSGMTANYWINRYTVIHIRRLLADKKLSFTEISDMFNFSSLAYFSRFVVKNLGAPPSKFRE
jgi:AraC-like DNA-binding protein